LANVLLFSSALILVLATGSLIAAQFFSRVILRFTELMALSFGLGTGFIFLEMFAVSWAGYRLRSGVLYAILAVNLVVLLPFAFVKLKKVLAAQRQPDKSKHGFIEILLIAVILLTTSLILVDSFVLPINSWDAIAIWSFKAKIFYSETIRHTLYFTDQTKSYSHPDYPVMIPFIQSYFYHAAGRVDDRLARMLFPSYFIFLLLFVYSALRRGLERKHALFFTALLASLPCFLSESVSGYVDVPFAFYYFPAILYLYLWMKENAADYIMLSAVFSALTVFAKNEGTAAFLISAVALAAFIILNRKKECLRHAGYYLVTSVVIMLPWLIFKRNITVIQEDYFSKLSLHNVFGNFDRLSVIFPSLFREFARLSNWNILWLIFAPAIIAGYKNFTRDPMRSLALILLMNIGLYVLIYVITPWDAQELIGFTLTRLLIHVAPIVVFICAEQTKYRLAR
jgi:hypothetical protein